jgi:hypothetical protein
MRYYGVQHKRDLVQYKRGWIHKTMTHTQRERERERERESIYINMYTHTHTHRYMYRKALPTRTKHVFPVDLYVVCQEGYPDQHEVL